MKESYFFTKKKILIGSLLLFILSLVILIILIRRYQRKNEKKHPKIINFYKCKEKQNSKIIADIFNDYGLNFSEENICNLYLPCGYNYIENELKLLKNNKNIKYIFGLNGCDKIVSKNSLWSLFNNYFGRKISSSILPETFILNNENEYQYLKNLYKDKKNIIMICKKNVQRKKGIKIIKNLNDLVNCKRENYKIAQKFINNSFLINNRKLNLRVYLLITSEKNRVDYYVYRKGKCLYANLEWNKKRDLVYEENITSSDMDLNIYNNHPHNFDELDMYLSENNIYNWNVIFNNIIVIFKNFYKVSNSLFKNQKYKNKKYFQLFGCDIILDNKFKPYLLEINKGPDMIPKIDKDYELKRKVYYDVFSKVGILPEEKNNFIKIN